MADANFQVSFYFNSFSIFKFSHIDFTFIRSGASTTGLPVPKELVLGPEILASLDKESSDLQNRIKTLQELTPQVKSSRLQSHSVELIWRKIEDIAQGADDQARQESWKFLESLIVGQIDHLGIMRAAFFRLIKGHFYTGTQDPKIDLDLDYRIKILDALTRKGKDIEHFEDEIGSFMQNLWPSILANVAVKNVLHTYLNIIINLLQYNAAFLDAGVIVSFIVAFTKICATQSQEEIKLCLGCLDKIICFSNIPKEGLFSFVCLLSKMVNLEDHCIEAWTISKRLMGTDFGHSALYSLCQILQTPDFRNDVALIRGAIFLAGMSLWGAQRVPKLDGYSAMTIIPIFESAGLQCRHKLVIFEVILQTERLVVKHYQKLKAPGCDAIVQLTETVINLIPSVIDSEMRPEITTHVNNIITTLEKLSIHDR